MKNVQITFSGFLFVFWLFLAFWLQDGWYRVDCALGIERACDLIQQEYTKTDRP